MHRSSFEKMAAFRDAYLTPNPATPQTVLDVGSAVVSDAGESYRTLFPQPAWHYLGLDMAPGPNVDLAPENPYRWDMLPDASIDVVVSGQAFEHIEWPWLTIQEIARVLRPGGLAAITAPSSGPVHRYPLDCWRYYPDALPALARYAHLDIIETHWDQGYAWPENAFWGDAFAILQKPGGSSMCTPRGALAALEATRLASLNPWSIRRRLLAETLRRIRPILRSPLNALRRL